MSRKVLDKTSCAQQAGEVRTRPKPAPQPRSLLAYRNSVIRRGLLSPHECRDLVAAALTLEATEATVGAEARHGVSRMRRSTIRWIPAERQFALYWDRIVDVFAISNQKYFGFDLDGFFETLQLTEYNENGKFDWHMDFNERDGRQRKLSLSIALNSPDEFEGGRFETITYGEATPHHLGIGDAIVFPSYIVHRVSPVLSGTRLSLVAWLAGPRFR